MAEFHFDNLAKNLPDVYRKDKDSNNYKILETERTANNVLREVLNEIGNILDIDNATGSTLDMYGKRFGQARGKATDAQYITMIKSKIIRGLSNGSYKNTIDAICYTFNCDKSEVLILETDEPLTVSVEKAPLTAIVRAGFSTAQAEQIIKNLLPVGSTISSILFEGTFEFAESEADAVYDEAKGFCDIEGGSIGGYLGLTGSQESYTDLPI